MIGDEGLDAALAEALRGGAPKDSNLPEEECRRALTRVHWHGVAGLLAGQQGWPAAFMTPVTAEARARAM